MLARKSKTMVLAATAYNLKKLLQYRPQQRLGLAISLPKLPLLPPAGLFRRRTRSYQLIHRLNSQKGT